MRHVELACTASDGPQMLQWGAGATLLMLFTLAVAGYILYEQFRIDVPSGHIAVLIKRTGTDLTNDQELAPNHSIKGLQTAVLTEGRYFYNPYYFEWHVYPMIEVPEGKMGIRIRMVGDDLPYGQFVTGTAGAAAEQQKGIVAEPLLPGRYPINAMLIGNESDRPRKDYVEIVELHEPVTISAGYKGVVTNLSGPMPTNPNLLLVEQGFRGVQQETLDPGRITRILHVSHQRRRLSITTLQFGTRKQRHGISQSRWILGHVGWNH